LYERPKSARNILANLSLARLTKTEERADAEQEKCIKTKKHCLALFHNIVYFSCMKTAYISNKKILI